MTQDPYGEQPSGQDPYGQQQGGYQSYGSPSGPQGPGAPNPYAGNPYGGNPYGAPAPDHPQATTILILGILSLMVCPVTGPFAWVMGGRAKREIDAAPHRYGGRGQVVAGYVTGIVGTLLMLGIVLVFVVAVLAAIASAS